MYTKVANEVVVITWFTLDRNPKYQRIRKLSLRCPKRRQSSLLCRAGGRTEALSFDHKPSQVRDHTSYLFYLTILALFSPFFLLQDCELNRITSAGGFVNQSGRVNGNLNSVRSIGDLKYKQVPGIHPAGQMITAEHDNVE
jgi:hypothetical protein